MVFLGSRLPQYLSIQAVTLTMWVPHPVLTALERRLPLRCPFEVRTPQLVSSPHPPPRNQVANHCILSSYLLPNSARGWASAENYSVLTKDLTQHRALWNSLPLIISGLSKRLSFGQLSSLVQLPLPISRNSKAERSIWNSSPFSPTDKPW